MRGTEQPGFRTPLQLGRVKEVWCTDLEFLLSWWSQIATGRHPYSWLIRITESPTSYALQFVWVLPVKCSCYSWIMALRGPMCSLATLFLILSSAVLLLNTAFSTEAAVVLPQNSPAVKLLSKLTEQYVAVSTTDMTVHANGVHDDSTYDIVYNIYCDYLYRAYKMYPGYSYMCSSHYAQALSWHYTLQELKL